MNEKTKIGLSDATLDSIIQSEKEAIIEEKKREKSNNWDEVMKLAEKYGFIRFAYGGFAMLSIYEEEIEK
jgi:hypothetical protein